MSWLMATPWMGIASASCETKLAESTWHTSTNFQVAASSTRNPRRSHNKSLHFFHVSVKANGVWEILIAGTGRGCMYHKPWRSSPGYLCDYQKRPSHTMNLKMLKTFSSPSERCPDLDLQIAIRQRTATRARSDGEARGFYSCLQTTPDWSCPAEADLLPFEEIVQMPKMVSSLEDIGSPKNQFATNGRS